MKVFTKLILCTILLTFSNVEILAFGNNSLTFSQWYNSCKQLPCFVQTGQCYSNKPPVLTIDLLENTLALFLQTMQKTLENPQQWVNNKISIANFVNPNFAPFTQKLGLPAGAQVVFHGDLHGDIHALVEYLNHLKINSLLDDTFKITKPNFYVVFLGDYTDRGNFGIEVIYTLMRLKIANPGNVFMVRGNHEDQQINVRFGFLEEMKTKFSNGTYFFDQIKKIYELMPVALYVGSDKEYIQCNHGGMEIGYLPPQLLAHPSTIACEAIEYLNRKTNFEQLKTSKQKKANDYYFTNIQPKNPIDINFLWGDFATDTTTETQFNSSRGTGWLFGKELTEQTLALSSSKNKKIVSVFRAHQHNGQMMSLILNSATPGLAKLWRPGNTTTSLWKGMVATFNVTPNTTYGLDYGFNYDTYGLLTIGTDFEKDWKLKIINLPGI